MNININDVYLSNNPYGFKLNINHPQINELYRRYKAWKNIPSDLPLTNKQRLEFESFILNNIKDIGC